MILGDFWHTPLVQLNSVQWNKKIEKKSSKEVFLPELFLRHRTWCSLVGTSHVCKMILVIRMIVCHSQFSKWTVTTWRYSKCTKMINFTTAPRNCDPWDWPLAGILSFTLPFRIPIPSFWFSKLRWHKKEVAQKGFLEIAKFGFNYSPYFGMPNLKTLGLIVWLTIEGQTLKQTFRNIL